MDKLTNATLNLVLILTNSHKQYYWNAFRDVDIWFVNYNIGNNLNLKHLKLCVTILIILVLLRWMIVDAVHQRLLFSSEERIPNIQGVINFLKEK